MLYITHPRPGIYRTIFGIEYNTKRRCLESVTVYSVNPVYLGERFSMGAIEAISDYHRVVWSFAGPVNVHDSGVSLMWFLERL
jgi:hypothetical protein